VTPMKIKRVLKWSALGILLILFTWFEFAYWTSSNECDRNAAAPTNPMKAIRYCEYGSPDDVLQLEEVERPVPNDNQILVRARAVSLRFFDAGMLQGGVGRLIFGLRKPRNTCPGSDFSGTVEAVGRNVTEFQPGAEVFGVRAGALAQYICVRRNGAMVSKPSNLSFEQAASVPTALVSLQGLRDKGHVKAGQKVLINGASGGVGTFAVQIAKAFGAEVIGVCSASFRSRFVREKFVTFGVSFSTKDLGILRDLAESGKVMPAVTKTYSLTETSAAYKYLQTGHARGKLVITMD